MSQKADQQNLIHIRALGFLSTKAGNHFVDVEKRFAVFLIEEVGVDEKEATRFIRMSFWKSFLTLQKPWQVEDRNEILLAFAREKELKEAGFSAKGLTLMAAEVERAEARLRELQQGFSEAKAEEEDS
jgi:hypothetical protein